MGLLPPRLTQGASRAGICKHPLLLLKPKPQSCESESRTLSAKQQIWESLSTAAKDVGALPGAGPSYNAESG